MGDIPEQQQGELQERKRWLEPKDYLTITLSTLAFVVSAGSAYFNILRTEESLVLVYDQVPFVSLIEGGLLLRHTDEGEIALINSGNRTAVVTEVSLFYMQPNANRLPSCDLETGSYFHTDFEPAALKQSDALVRKVKATKPKIFIFTNPTVQLMDTQDFLLPLSEYNRGAEDVLIDVWLDIRLSTPSTDYYTARFPIIRFHATKDGSFWDPITEGQLISYPVVLIKRTGTIFDY